MYLDTAQKMREIFVGQKGDEMTEVVTSTAASSQLNLLAHRQQVFVVERDGTDSGFASADTAPTAVDQFADAFAQSHSSQNDDQNPVNHHQDQAAPAPRAEAPVSGPSRARVEIKHIDLGLTPSEVVGTPDILQRFDTNGDGRVDLSEAARAGLAREGVFTFAGLGAATQRPEQPQTPEVLATGDAAASAAPALTAGVAPQVEAAATGDKKIFTETDLPGAKKFAVAAAAQGTPTGVADVPKKFYGQGAEVVVGKFAADNGPKIADKADEKPKIVTTETDTGETKIHTKVAQTDTDQSNDQNGNSNGGEGATYERAKRVAAAEGRNKKVVLVEVAAYADAATAPDAASTATVVTA